MLDPQTGKPRKVQINEIDVDAGTLLTIAIALLLIPLLISGFWFH